MRDRCPRITLTLHPGYRTSALQVLQSPQRAATAGKLSPDGVANFVVVHTLLMALSRNAILHQISERT
jgi:hypothetical protein